MVLIIKSRPFKNKAGFVFSKYIPLLTLYFFVVFAICGEDFDKADKILYILISAII
jgi:hypothetical protein